MQKPSPQSLTPILISAITVIVLAVGGFFVYTSVFTKSSQPQIVSQNTSQALSTKAVISDIPNKEGSNSTPNTESTATTASTNSCIITVSGQKYNVDELRVIHAGGDVFKCGTDMTESYKDQHGSSVRRLQRYIVK